MGFIICIFTQNPMYILYLVWKCYSQPSFSAMQYVLSRARGGRTTFSRSPFFWTLVIRSTSEKSRATTSSCITPRERKHMKVKKVMTTMFWRDRFKYPVTECTGSANLAVFSPPNLQVLLQQQLTYDFRTYSPDGACKVKLAEHSDMLSKEIHHDHQHIRVNRIRVYFGRNL